ncbi:MAG: hypothetical protein LUP97_02465 [Methanoregula sp.]|nr:hypothetical protein [Methanoregula sp.]
MVEEDRGSVNGEMEIRFRDCLSVRYSQSAALLCRLGYEIESSARKTGDASSNDLLRHEAFILNSVLSSVAFLESTINELHADAADGAYYFANEKQEILLRDISERWRNEKNFDRAPLISKYQRILEITEKCPFSDHEEAFANIRLLLEIRNNLLHYKREWVVIPVTGPGVPTSKGGSTVDRFEKILRAKFAINPLAAKNQPFFPDKCLGHGCAEWAVLNSLIFTDAFFRRLGLPAPYEGIREDLATR